jgi:Domain of unknown function (DUF4390)
MHCSANVKAFFALCLLGGLLSHSAGAGTPAVTVKKAELNLKGDSYLLSAEITYQLSAKALDALQNGIPLFWSVHIKVQKQRDYLWNKTLINKKLRYRIQYHALLNMYRIRNEQSGEMANFSTLAAALAMMSSIQDTPLLKKTEVDPENRYIAGIKVAFDRESLPLPLRPMSYLNPQWYLSSDWYLWSLAK